MPRDASRLRDVPAPDGLMATDRSIVEVDVRLADGAWDSAPAGDRGLPAEAGVPATSACDPANVVDFNATAIPDGPDLVATIAVGGGDAAQRGTCGGAGPERAFHFTAPSTGRWGFGAEASPGGAFFDAVLYARSACDDPTTELACDAQVPTIEISLEAGQGTFVLVDGRDAGAEGAVGVRARVATLAGEGEFCDLAGVPRACRDGLICRRRGADAVCLSFEGPAITAAEGFFDLDSRLLTVALHGTDQDDNPSAIEVVPLDVTGSPIPNPEVFPVFVAEAGEFSATATCVVGSPLVVFGATVAVRDRAGLESEPFAIPALVRTRHLGEGEACDPERLRSVCGPALECAPDEAGGPPTCRPVHQDCDAVAVDLSALPPDAEGTYVWEGDTRNGLDATDNPCRVGPTGPEQLVRFTAPAPGDWVFNVWPAGGAAPLRVGILSVQLGCDATRGRLACGSLEGTATLTLEAGQVLYLQIDGFGDMRGTYRLTARGLGPVVPPVGPTLRSVVLAVPPGLGIVRLTIAGDRGDSPMLDAVAIDLFAQGEPIALGEGFGTEDEGLPDTGFEIAFEMLAADLALLDLADVARISVRDGNGRWSDPMTVEIDRNPGGGRP